MGIAYPVYGSMVEVGGSFTLYQMLSTAPANFSLGTFTIPTYAELGGKLIGAYCDVIIGRHYNSHAGDNWMLADAGDPYIRIYDGSTYKTAKSDVTLSCSSKASGVYSGFRYYGDKNLCYTTALEYNTTYTVYLWNARSQNDNLWIYDIQPVVRCYIT